jgi:hypothetical protein
MKYLCAHCNNLAVWYYMPASEWWTEKSRYLCDVHIEPHRGCSCSTEVDDQGRLLPCVEFDYNPDGFEPN